MPSPEVLLDRVERLARENASQFGADPAALERFRAALERHEFRYATDPIVCGRRDCAYSWRDLVARDGPDGPWWADCLDLSALIAGACIVRQEPIAVGVIPNPTVSHAVIGVPRGGGRVDLGDPSCWFGMPPMGRDSYAKTRWRVLVPPPS